MPIPHAIIDTETTGLQPGSRMVEVAMIAIDIHGEHVSHYSTLVNPGMPIPPDVTKIHGLTDADLADAPTTKEALRSLREWMEDVAALGAVGIAHNAPYDVGILSWEAARVGMFWPLASIIDTCAMAKAIKATKNNKLATLVEHHGIQVCGHAHRAYADADACRQYFKIARTKTAPEAVPWAPEYTYTDDLPSNLADLPEIVANGGTMSFGYVDANGTKSDRVVTPYGWAMQPYGLEFHGLCHLRDERRSFRVDRITA